MALNIGLNVIEVDGTATPALPGAPVSVAAFAVTTKRGVPTQPVRVTSFTQFLERFGGFTATSLGAYLLKGFFDNGGRTAYVSRVVGTAANAPATASAVLPAGASGAAVLLRASAGYRGNLDPGTWGNELTVQTAPSFTTTVTGATVDAAGATLASVAGFSVGDPVVVTEGADRGVVTLATVDAGTGAVTWTPNLANNANFDASATSVASAAFDLTVVSRASGKPVALETWSRVSLQRGSAGYAPTVLNDPGRGSRYVTLGDPRANPTGPDAPGTTSVDLAQGADGTTGPNDVVGDGGARTGLFAFDGFDVQLVATERTDPVVVQAALAYCEQRGDCMYVGAVPEGAVGAGTAIDYGARFQGAKVFGALYGPWISVQDPLSKAVTPVRSVPPTGHVLGVYARTEATRGIHKAPAGDGARLLGALDVEYRLSDADLTDLVKLGSVNGIRAVPGSGIVVDASRTLSTDPRWLYVNVRLLFNYVKSSLKQGLRWVRQEPNRDTLWTAVKYGSIRPFLIGLWQQGAFGSGEPDQVFTIICDATNNPPDQVDLGNFTVEVFFYPSRPAETVVIKVGQQPSGASASEA